MRSLTIGRNVGNLPLPVNDWLNFVDESRALVRVAELPVTTRYGKRSWKEQHEITAQILSYVGGAPTMRWLLKVRTLAAKYDQECIAVTFGDIDRELYCLLVYADGHIKPGDVLAATVKQV